MLIGMNVLHAQTRDVDQPPFAAGAITLGALGFARPPITTSVVGGYGYGALHDLLIGRQGGGTVGDRGRSNASYGLATIGYAVTRRDRRQFYPFLGFGAGVLRARPGLNHTGILGGAGLGTDVLLGTADHGPVIGMRAGHVARSVNDDESVAYFVLAFGAGRHARSAPPAVVARR
jgi:hypothetical protein